MFQILSVMTVLTCRFCKNILQKIADPLVQVYTDGRCRNYQKRRVIRVGRQNSGRLPSRRAGKRASPPSQTRRGAARCRPSSSRWCSLLNQRGIQMAADAPGIQIGAINPRKAALELQPNVSQPRHYAAVARATAPPPACSRNLAEHNSFHQLGNRVVILILDVLIIPDVTTTLETLIGRYSPTPGLDLD